MIIRRAADIRPSEIMPFGVPPLGAMSSNLAIRRLGGKVWQRLHRFVCLAAILAVLHFLMSVKSWPIEPVTYALIVAILLGYRLARSLMRGQGQGKLKRI